MKQIMVNGKPLSQMTLGTVQLGMNYGIANKNGQPDAAKRTAMLRCAFENGITSIDTARAYGAAEDALGSFFREHKPKQMPFLTTKLLINLENASDREVEAAMYASVERSLKTLGVNQVDCLLLHDSTEMTKYGSIVPKTLKGIADNHYAKMTGVSVYFADEVETMLQDDVYQAIQVPMSIFDQQLITGGYIDRLHKKDVLVFVRSVFLQGVFFLDPAKMTDPLLVEYAKPYVEKLHEFCERAGMSIAEFAISFMRDVPGVTSLVLGADTEEQVWQNITYMNAPSISDSMREEVTEAFRGVNIPKIMEVLSRPKQ